MGRFSVSAGGLPTVEVLAPNWIAALGQALEELGRASEVERMACERLPNGTVIARDVSSGVGFVVQDRGPDPAEEEDLPMIEPVPLDELEERLLDVEGAPGAHSATRAALRVAVELCGAESGAVLLHQGSYLRFVAVSGPHASRLDGVRLPEGTGVAGFAMRTGRPVVLSDASRDERHCGHVDALTGYHTRALIAAPLPGPEQVSGVIEIMNPTHALAFDRRDVQRLTTIGQALGRRLAELGATERSRR